MPDLNDRVPPNCTFEIDDVEKEWLWSQPFDFIFCRGLGGSFANTQEVMRKAFEYANRGIIPCLLITSRPS